MATNQKGKAKADLDEVETLQVNDNVSLTLRSLKIAHLKKTMRAMNQAAKKLAADQKEQAEARKAAEEEGTEFEELDELDGAELDTVVAGCFAALQQDNSEVVTDTDWVENNLNPQQLERILEKTAGFETNTEVSGN